MKRKERSPSILKTAIFQPCFFTYHGARVKNSRCRLINSRISTGTKLRPKIFRLSPKATGKAVQLHQQLHHSTHFQNEPLLQRPLNRCSNTVRHNSLTETAAPLQTPANRFHTGRRTIVNHPAKPFPCRETRHEFVNLKTRRGLARI